MAQIHAVDRFKSIASEDRFIGWPLVGGYNLGEKIPFFGQVLAYQLRTGNGVEDYYSIIRHFGWAVTFGVTTNNEVITLVQWKPGVNTASWELPPGGIGRIDPGISESEILATTEKVFLKETGYGEGQWQKLTQILVETGKYRGSGPNDHGLAAHLYLATDLKQIAESRAPNRNEIMETLMVPLDQFWDVIDSHLFNEASALPCALLALRRLGL